MSTIINSIPILAIETETHLSLYSLFHVVHMSSILVSPQVLTPSQDMARASNIIVNKCILGPDPPKRAAQNFAGCDSTCQSNYKDLAQYYFTS